MQHAASLTLRTAASVFAASELRRTNSVGRLHRASDGGGGGARGGRERRYSFSEMRSWEGLQVRGCPVPMLPHRQGPLGKAISAGGM